MFDADRPRLVPGWRRIVLIGLPLVLALGAALSAYAFTAAGTPRAALATAPLAADVPAPAGLLVHVVGAVAKPGLYRMRRGDRVYDAIAAAGGLSSEADPAKLPDLAKRLTDGEQIKVAARKGTGATTSTRTNLNTATLEELEVVPGFTTALAEDVIAYRTNYGGIQATRELVDILGMSEADYLVARRYLTL